MPWILLQHHDGNIPSKHRNQVIRAGATRSLEAHLTHLDGHREGQAATEIRHWTPMPLNKHLTSPLRGSTIRTRVPLADRTWRVPLMHLR